MSTRSDCIVGANIVTDAADFQLALMTDDRQVELFIRNRPSLGEVARWVHLPIAASYWPTQSIKKRQTFVKTLENYIKPKVISNGGPLKVKGFTAILISTQDHKDLDSVPTPEGLFGSLERELQETQPRGWSFDSHLALAEWLADGIILALDDDSDLAPWTVSLLSKPKAVPVVSADDLRDGIELMDGTRFIPRKRKSGFTDVSSLQTLHQAYMAGEGLSFVYLRGEPGVGKSSLAQAAFIDLYQPLGLSFEDHFVINGTGSTRVKDIRGGMTQNLKTGTFEFKKGPLVWAMECGVPLLVDEAPRIKPEELAVILPAIDGRGFIEMPPDSGMETVHAKKGFYVVFAGNPSDLGARLSKAVQSRAIVQPWYRTDYDIVRRLIGPEYDELITVARMMEAERLAGRASWAPQTRECKGFALVAKYFGTEEAISNLCSLPESPRDKETIRRLFKVNMGVEDIEEYAW